MSWSQMTSWVLFIGGVAAIVIGLLIPGRAKLGRSSRRGLFAATGAILIVAAGVLIVAVTIFRSLRSMPI